MPMKGYESLVCFITLFLVKIINDKKYNDFSSLGSLKFT